MKVAQAALAKTVSFGSARMGFSTINDHGKHAVDDIDKGNNRQEIADLIFASRPKSGTPLRSALQRTGEYFKGSKSPILSTEEKGMCQQNFAILMSDGYWDNEKISVGNQDGRVGGLVRKSDSDDYSNTLADVAMKYYKEDLRPDLENVVPIVPGIDENTAQHLVTYTLGFGVNGNLTENPVDPDKKFDWPKPFKNQPSSIDDMRHAAWNSRGEFLSAADPEALNAAFTRIFQNINARSSSVSGLEVGTNSDRSDNVLIEAKYDPSSWEGDIVARPFGGDGFPGDARWVFSQQLRELQDRHLTRQVLTINPQGESDEAFYFNADNIEKMSRHQVLDLGGFFNKSVLTLADKKNVNINVSPGSDQVHIKNVKIDKSHFDSLMNYLKGDAASEGEAFRKRNGQYLGDIIGSYPIIVNAPAESYIDAIAKKPYSAFRGTYGQRAGMIYVGANDGMLHAIDEATGAEKFAFMPHGVFSAESGEGVRQLADKDYLHRFYVDATPVARDAFVTLPGETEAAWHTLLLGGLGGGGKSVYMLDITDPETFDALGSTTTPGDIVKWEFDHLDLGYSFSDIHVAKLVNDSWYAIFGNGYNAESDGKAKLFIVSLENPDDYALIDTGAGSNDNGNCLEAASDCNGLSSPQVADIDGDGIA
ncbi:pilus assembly protein, partial [Halomonas sp. PR-M31]|uniref:pilus assembly protein n=1 Tax=Halomonas sp. PR-M31 TaxID=1471202 RepID=UPI000650604A